MYRLPTFFLIFFFIQLNSQSLDDDYLKLKSLTEAQKQIISYETKKIKESREIFKRSLTQAQIEILKSEKLTKEQKRFKLMQSFSSSQRNIINESERRVKVMAKKIKPTLTDNQKRELKAINSRMSKMKKGDSRGTRIKQGQLDSRRKSSRNDNRNKRP